MEREKYFNELLDTLKILASVISLKKEERKEKKKERKRVPAEWPFFAFGSLHLFWGMKLEKRFQRRTSLRSAAAVWGFRSKKTHGKCIWGSD